MATYTNLAEVFEAVGDVPPQRIRLDPTPGSATEADVAALLNAANKRLCELVDGVLVEKAMGTREALLAGLILHYVHLYLEEHDIGEALGADGTVRLMPGLVRIPDVSFTSWERIPGGVPEEAVGSFVPDLAVEVLSEGNTKGEMARKRRDYFLAGVREVWEIQPKTQTAAVYTTPSGARKVGKNQSIDGGAILPGFKLSLKQLFDRASRRRSPGK